jgi:mono/diheme cytochrome c family protein
MRLSALVLATAGTLAGLVGTPGAEEEVPRTTQDGVYTAEQAERGKERYKRDCAGCHPLDWYKGGVMKAWGGAPLKDLYDAVSVKMPPSNPGSLKRTEYAALLAYILALNDMPPGREDLPDSPEALQKIRIQWRNKP